jgi:hypothetical protein
MVQCVATREASPWNGLKMTALPAEWTTMWVNPSGDAAAPAWFRNFFRVFSPQRGAKAVDDGYTLRTSQCGEVTDTDKVKGVQSLKAFFALRYLVVNEEAEFCQSRRRRLSRGAALDVLWEKRNALVVRRDALLALVSGV